LAQYESELSKNCKEWKLLCEEELKPLTETNLDTKNQLTNLTHEVSCQRNAMEVIQDVLEKASMLEYKPYYIENLDGFGLLYAESAETQILLQFMVPSHNFNSNSRNLWIKLQEL